MSISAAGVVNINGLHGLVGLSRLSFFGTRVITSASPSGAHRELMKMTLNLKAV